MTCFWFSGSFWFVDAEASTCSAAICARHEDVFVEIVTDCFFRGFFLVTLPEEFPSMWVVFRYPKNKVRNKTENKEKTGFGSFAGQSGKQSG